MDTAHEGLGGDPDAGALAEQRAAFVARITAAATHEFRNILAIVKESSGLVDDLITRAGSVPPDQEKLRWALDRIRLQVARGSDLSTSLNRVMHGLDREQEPVALPDALAHAVRLAQRFARQQQCTIELGEPADEVVVTANVLDLYRALVITLEWCVGRMTEGGTVVVEATPWEGRPAVRFSAGPAAPGLTTTDDVRGRLEAARVEVAGIRTDTDALVLVFD